ncbi:MAG: tyrosine--tRNA ligase, partial [Bacteroidota bacterium]
MQSPHLRILQKALAKDITVRVHGEAEYEYAVAASDILFGQATAQAFSTLNEATFLDIFEGVPQFDIQKSELEIGVHIVDLLAEKTQVFASKGEARKMLQGGGVSMNKIKCEDANAIISATSLINGKYLIAQKGKKNYYLIKAV